MQSMIDFLDLNGYTTRTKAARTSTSADRQIIVHNSMLVELTIDALTYAPACDHMILFAGDADYSAMVERVQQEDVRVTLVANGRSSSPTVSMDLRLQADHFLEMEDLLSVAMRDAARRPS